MQRLERLCRWRRRGRGRDRGGDGKMKYQKYLTVLQMAIGVTASNRGSLMPLKRKLWWVGTNGAGGTAGRAGQGGGRCAWPSAGRGGTGGLGVPPRHDGRLWGAVPRPGRGAERERACGSRRASPGQKVPGEFTAGRVENAGRRRRRRRRRSCPRRASPCLARPRARRRTPGSALCAAGNRDPARNDSRVRSYALRETCCRTLVRARQWQLQLRGAGVSQAGAAEVLPPTVAHSPPCAGQCPKPGSGFPSPCYCWQVCLKIGKREIRV